MNILMFGWEFPPHIAGGLGVACFGLTRGLHELGSIQLTFVIPRVFGDEDGCHLLLLGASEEPLAASVPATPVRMFAIPSTLQPYMTEAAWPAARGERDALALPGLFEEVLAYADRATRLLEEAGACSLIHAHDWMTFPAAIAVADQSGKPLVVHMHSTEFDRSGSNVDLRIVDIERRAMDRADHIIAVSEMTRQVLVRSYGQCMEKISVIHNAIVPYAPLSRPARAPRAPAPPLVTFVGRVTWQKGPAYFIEAAHLVLQRRPDVRFVLAGDGDLLAFVKELALSVGIAGHIEFPGFLAPDAVRGLHERSAVFVMPSVSEPFGIAALEAIACDVPVIVSNRAGVSEVIDSMVVVAPDDVDTIAAEILRLLDDTAYADGLRHGARCQLEQRSWRHAAEQLIVLYREVQAGFPAREHCSATTDESTAKWKAGQELTRV